MNIAYKAALSYIGLCFTGILFLALEKNDDFIRKSAAQAFVLGIAEFLIRNSLLMLPFVGHNVSRLFRILFFVLLLFLIVKALNNIYFKLPIISDISEKYVVNWFK